MGGGGRNSLTGIVNMVGCGALDPDPEDRALDRPEETDAEVVAIDPPVT
jgi:hypothetical protein